MSGVVSEVLLLGVILGCDASAQSTFIAMIRMSCRLLLGWEFIVCRKGSFKARRNVPLNLRRTTGMEPCI
jgi:hypothetical protein